MKLNVTSPGGPQARRSSIPAAGSTRSSAKAAPRSAGWWSSWSRNGRWRLTDSHVSSGGRYVSMNLEVTVDGDEERLALYRLLAADPAIRVVL